MAGNLKLPTFFFLLSLPRNSWIPHVLCKEFLAFSLCPATKEIHNWKKKKKNFELCLGRSHKWFSHCSDPAWSVPKKSGGPMNLRTWRCTFKDLGTFTVYSLSTKAVLYPAWLCASRIILASNITPMVLHLTAYCYLFPFGLLAFWGQGPYFIHLCMNKSRFIPI